MREGPYAYRPLPPPAVIRVLAFADGWDSSAGRATKKPAEGRAFHRMAGSGALGRLQRFDVGRGLALVGDQGDEVVALGVARIEIVAGLAE